MKNRKASFFFFALLLLLSLFRTPAAANGLSGHELDDESSEYNYEEGSGKGPEDWWHLREEWKVCKFGLRQSPIDLTDPIAVDVSLGMLRTFRWPSFAILRNSGHHIMLEWPNDAGVLWIDGAVYKLKQCHWHNPAEHEIGGWRPDLEMHMVHESSDSKVAVVGVLYKYGTPDPFLAQLEEPLKRIASGETNNADVGHMFAPNLEMLKPYFRYDGSLTTPPCTEGVVWTVFLQVLTASHEQVELLKAAVGEEMNKNNSRPIQPRNGRTLVLYPPWSSPDKNVEKHASS